MKRERLANVSTFTEDPHRFLEVGLLEVLERQTLSLQLPCGFTL